MRLSSRSAASDGRRAVPVLSGGASVRITQFAKVGVASVGRSERLNPVPSPEDVLVNTLIWLGVPALVLTPFLVAFGIAQWVTFARHAAKVARTVARVTSGEVKGVLRRTWASVLWLGVMQATLIAATYSLFRLVYAMGIDDSAGRNIADGKSFTFSELWVNLTTYSNESTLSVQAALLALGWVLAFDLSALVRNKVARNVLMFPAAAVAIVAVGGAVLIGLVGLMVLSLATWMNAPGYNIGMVSLYAMWVILLVLISSTIWGSFSQASRTFRGTPDGSNAKAGVTP